MKALGLSVIGLLALAGAWGCRPGAEADLQPLVVAVSGDTAGWIVPCGCTTHQSGGLPRRASFIEQLRGEAAVIVADVGGAAGGPAPYDRFKFETILQGEIAMGIAAHNIGGSEALLGPRYLRDVAGRLHVPLVSANVSDGQNRPVAPPARIVEAAGRRVAFVGVLGQEYATDQLRVAPPARAILDALRGIAGRYDALVVLGYLDDDQLRGLAAALPEADLIVGGPTGQPLPPEPIGPTLLASATNQGKFLARFDAPARGSSHRWTGTIVEVDQRFDDHPKQIENLETFYRGLARRDFTPEQTSFGQRLAFEPPGQKVAGTESCRACHAEDCRLWDGSKHAQAWDSLRRQGTHVDPACQRCHTTAYGLPGGFVSVARSPGLVGVGCESCHGPAWDHGDDPGLRTTYFERAGDHCVDCHDRENSPQFDYDAYWTRIRHGTQQNSRNDDLPFGEAPP